jgi:hypothetical protein
MGAGDKNKDDDEYGGLGFEYVNSISLAIKNYISRDPAALATRQPGQTGPLYLQ